MIRSVSSRCPGRSALRGRWALASVLVFGLMMLPGVSTHALAGADSSRHAHHKQHDKKPKAHQAKTHQPKAHRQRAETPQVHKPAVRRHARPEAVKRDVRKVEVRRPAPKREVRPPRHAQRVAHRPVRHHDRADVRKSERSVRHHAVRHHDHRNARHGFGRHDGRDYDRHKYDQKPDRYHDHRKHHQKDRDRGGFSFDFRIGSGHVNRGHRGSHHTDRGYRHHGRKSGHCDRACHVRGRGDHVDRQVCVKRSSRCHTVYSCKPRGRWETRWVPPVYRHVRDRCGNVRRVCVSPGKYQRVWVEIRVGGRF
ncbi:MAG: hypothetical protein AAF328_10885 [Planctomycetota bacterium]